AASSGKCRYTVERRTPARSATALIDVRAGPSFSCSSTALSVIRSRVCSTSSALFVISYLRLAMVTCYIRATLPSNERETKDGDHDRGQDRRAEGREG